MYRLEAIDFGRRMAVEKQIEQTETAPQPNAVFDESSNFLIYATLLGIKVGRNLSFYIHIFPVNTVMRAVILNRVEAITTDFVHLIWPKIGVYGGIGF